MNDKEKRRRKRIRKRNRRKVRIKILTFILHYIIPIILVLAGFIIAIFAPMNYYYSGNFFNITKAAYTIIPIAAILEFIAYKINIKWLSILRQYDIIK